MRVAVELVHSVQTAEHETEERFPGQVLLFLALLQQLAPRHAVHQLGGENPTGAEGGEHLRDVDEGMTAVVVGEQHLVGRLAGVIQFLADAFFHLVHQIARVETAEALLQQEAQQVGVAQIGVDRFVDARILHLDRDGALLAGRRIEDDRAMHLADRRRGDRNGVPLDEEFAR